MRLVDTTFCVLDLETTGCDPAVDAITEIGAVKVRGGEVLGELATLVNARQAIPIDVCLLTGTSDALLADAPTIDQVLPSVVEFARGCVLVGHNLGFDLRFLAAALARRREEPLDGAVIDTLPLARLLLREDTPDCRLTTLAAALGLASVPTHRALADARATVELLHALIERATGHGVWTLDDLLELPRVCRHPQSHKLAMTDRLPRGPGVYAFHGGGDEVIHVGRGTDIRRRVRSWFASRDRRIVAPMLREVQRISSLPCDDELVAAVVELRLRQQHRPRYDRARQPPRSGWRYVHVDPSARRPRPRAVVTPRSRGLHLGPLPTRAMTALVLEALELVGPRAAVAAVAGDTAHALAALQSHGNRRATVRAQALAGALERQELLVAAQRRGVSVVCSATGVIVVEHGLLVGAGSCPADVRSLPVPPVGTPEAGSSGPVPPWAVPEVLLVERHLRRLAARSGVEVDAPVGVS